MKIAAREPKGSGRMISLLKSHKEEG